LSSLQKQTDSCLSKIKNHNQTNKVEQGLTPFFLNTIYIVTLNPIFLYYCFFLYSLFWVFFKISFFFSSFTSSASYVPVLAYSVSDSFLVLLIIKVSNYNSQLFFCLLLQFWLAKFDNIYSVHFPYMFSLSQFSILFRFIGHLCVCDVVVKKYSATSMLY